MFKVNNTEAFMTNESFHVVVLKNTVLHVAHCKNICFTLVFVLAIRYFIMYNFSFMFLSVNNKFYSRDLSVIAMCDANKI